MAQSLSGGSQKSGVPCWWSPNSYEGLSYFEVYNAVLWDTTKQGTTSVITWYNPGSILQFLITVIHCCCYYHHGHYHYGLVVITFLLIILDIRIVMLCLFCR